MMKLMVALVVLLAAATTTTTTAARAAVGFSVLTENEGLFVFDSLEALKNFTPKIIPIPLGGSPAVSMAADEASGHFIVLGATAVAALDASSGRFKQTFSFSPSLQFHDVAFAKDGRAVALGRLPMPVNPVFQRAVFATTTDGGFTWNISSSLVDGRTKDGTGRIAFSGNNGVMTLGAYIATSSDSGRTWSPAQGYPMSITRLALNQRVSIATGSSLDVYAEAIGITTDLWQSIKVVRSPDGKPISGIVIASPVEFVVSTATGFGGVWRTTNGGLTWTRILDWMTWTDLTYSAALGVYLVVGNEYLVLRTWATLSYSTDGVSWFNSPAFTTRTFIRAIPAVPFPLHWP